MRSKHTNEKRLAGIAIACLFVTILCSFLFFRAPVIVQDPATFAKEFGLELRDYAGEPVHLYSYRRQVLVVYAWASWCSYCSTELTNLAKLKQTYGDAVQIIAVNRAEPLAIAKAFSDKVTDGSGIIFLLDSNDAFFKQVGGYAMPETVFISPAGDIVYHQRGPIPMTDVDERIKALIH